MVTPPSNYPSVAFVIRPAEIQTTGYFVNIVAVTNRFSSEASGQFLIVCVIMNGQMGHVYLAHLHFTSGQRSPVVDYCRIALKLY
jgi:hypothetical protein